MSRRPMSWSDTLNWAAFPPFVVGAVGYVFYPDVARGWFIALMAVGMTMGLVAHLANLRRGMRSRREAQSSAPDS
ncbi:MAG: hypothetical protein HOV79_21095 [Hamadaea sp.]|nr:hypothetical protein [Hamadaea sp.]